MAVAGFLVLLLLLFVALMLPAGIVLIVLSRRGRRAHPACGGCGYNLTGFRGESDTCPECGGKYTQVGILPAQSTRRKGMLGWGIAMVVVPLLVAAFFVSLSFAARNRAATAAQQQRQQAQVAALRQQMTTLTMDLQLLKNQRDAATDAAAAAALDKAIADYERLLGVAQRQIDALSAEPSGGNK
jgi:flagellar basal body-associated protein FliL